MRRESSKPRQTERADNDSITSLHDNALSLARLFFSLFRTPTNDIPIYRNSERKKEKDAFFHLFKKKYVKVAF